MAAVFFEFISNVCEALIDVHGIFDLRLDEICVNDAPPHDVACLGFVSHTMRAQWGGAVFNELNDILTYVIF